MTFSTKNMFILMSLLSVSSAEFKEIQHKKVSTMAQAVVEMIEHLKVENVPTATIIRPATLYDNSITDEIIAQVSSKLKNSMTLKLFEQEAFKLANKRSETQLNIAVIRNILEFKPILTFSAHKLLHFREHLIVAYDDRSESRYIDVEKMLFIFFDLLNVTNIVFLVHGEGEHEIDVFTGFPFQAGQCDGFEVRKVNSFQNKKFERNDFFTDKFSNLNGCEITLIPVSLLPRDSFYYFDKRTGETYGVDVSLLDGKIYACFVSFFLINEFFPLQ